MSAKEELLDPSERKLKVENDLEEPESLKSQNDTIDNSVTDTVAERPVADAPPIEPPTRPMPPTIDEESGVVTIAVEDLIAAGIDVENLSSITQEELAKVIALSKRNATETSTGNGSSSKKGDSNCAVSTVQQAGGEVVERPVNSCAQNPHTSQENDSWSLVVTEEGNIRLTDSHNHAFLFTRDVLQTHNIDVHNLSENNIQALLALAIPIPKIVGSEEPSAKKAKLSDPALNSYVVEDPHHGKQVHEYSLIGEEVEVRKDGQVTPATIRYCREGPGPNYKVQFADGHFEWVEESQIVLSLNKNAPSVAHGRPLASPATNPKKNSGVPGSGVRVSTANRTSTAGEHETSYCCQVCDKKVAQKEPTYIVVRIPACHSCAEKQMFVLDENDVIPTKTETDPKPTSNNDVNEPNFKERKTSSAPLQGSDEFRPNGTTQRCSSADCCPIPDDVSAAKELKAGSQVPPAPCIFQKAKEITKAADSGVKDSPSSQDKNST